MLDLLNMEPGNDTCVTIQVHMLAAVRKLSCTERIRIPLYSDCKLSIRFEETRWIEMTGGPGSSGLAFRVSDCYRSVPRLAPD
jgi:hypothetical protein